MKNFTIRKLFTISLFIFGLLAVNVQAQLTYTWNRTDSADFQVATNWTPDRTTPSATDVLVFNNGATGTVLYNIPPTQLIAGFQVTNNTFVRITNGATTLITISGGTGPQFFIGAGSTLEVCGAATKDSVGFNLATGTTATVSGTFTMKSYAGSPAHRFRVKDASGAIFNNGSIFTFGPLAGGNVFGVQNASQSGNNSVVFANGSRFVQKSGANPFAQTAPNSFVVFNTGSIFDCQVTAPAFSGRTYANFEVNINVAVSGLGGGTLTMDNITINDGSLGLNMTGRVNIKGNITVASGKTMSITPASNPTDSLVFNGTSQQSISGAGTFTITNTITIQNKVVLNNAAGLVLNKNVTIPGTLVLLSGNITTGANTLTLGTGILTLGTLARTSGTIVGRFSRWFGGSVVSNVLFPVGTATNYRPASISFTTNPFGGGTITISHTDGADGSDLTVPINDGGYNIERRSNMFWTASSNFSDGIYSMSVDGNGQTGITNIDSLRLIYSPDGTTFSAPGTHVNGSGSSVANRSGLTGGVTGNFYLGGNNTSNPLPVELDNFVATTIKNEVILDWATGHELNNTGFEVERAILSSKQHRTDADLSFERIAFIPSKGNSNSVQGYKYVDGNLVIGRFAYRLKQMDYNGNHTYYLLNNEIEISTPRKFTVSQNYPNPFNPTTSIAYDMPFNGNVKIVVFDNVGREVATLVNGNINSGYHKVEFNASAFSSGIYFYKVSATSGTESFDKVYKMMLVK
jgi:hypothetical protein